MFGRKQNTLLLSLPSQITNVDRTQAMKNKDELARKQTEFFNKTAKSSNRANPSGSKITLATSGTKQSK